MQTDNNTKGNNLFDIDLMLIIFSGMKNRKYILFVLILAFVCSFANGFLPHHSHFDHCEKSHQKTKIENEKCQTQGDYCLSCLLKAKNVDLSKTVENSNDFEIFSIVHTCKLKNIINQESTGVISYHKKIDYPPNFLEEAFSRRAPPHIII